MSRSVDITNVRYGKLLAIKRVEDYISPKGAHSERWECKCDCGNKIIVSKGSLKNGHTKSCGCYREEYKRKPLEYTIQDNAVMVICGKTCFLVDVEDLDFVKRHGWHISKNGYVTRNSDKKTLHRLLMGADTSELVDHINQCKLDNRKCNLRFADYSINGYNKKITTGKTGEPYIAVSKDYYSVTIDGRYIGGSYDLEKAKSIRDSKIKSSKAYKYNIKLKSYL